MIRWLAVLSTAMIATVSLAAEEGPRTLGWSDLVPKSAPFDNPFIKLSMDQQSDVESLVAIRNLERRSGISSVSEDAEEAVEVRYRLQKQGLDPSALILAFDRLESEIVRRNNMTVGALDGKLIRIPGYALPLEHTGTGVTEMLLVPYIGACIHVPPPPANQTLFVKLNQSYKADNLFEPVWVTGRMKVRSINKSLSFVDGSAGVATAYTVEAAIVRPYTR